MDVSKNGTDNLFSLPVALFLRNGSDLDEGMAFEYGGSTSRNLSQTNHDWNKVVSSFPGGPSRSEKIGETVRKELKWAFILHTYGFGCLFFILAFYTFFSVLNLRSFISTRPFMSTINGFLCLLGTSRAGSLLIDPYNLKENMPKIIGQILWDLGFPSIISAFCLVQLAFLQLTQLQIGPEGLRRKSCLSLIVTAHFILTVGMDIVVASHENLMVMKHVIHYIFLTWGVVLCCNFLYSGYKVMAMIRSIPGGLKHRDLPDPSYKGIMQLAILAPHNNLAGSVTAALLPTLCAPKIHQQDNTSLSTVGFRNDGNSRILESESIPILEEIAGSSGDEKNTKLLSRGSSFQNQTRNTQKFNLKPKLSLRSISDEDVRDEDGNQGKNAGPKSPRSISPKTPSPKQLSSKVSEFDFNVKSINGVLKRTESFVTTKSVQEFKSKIPQTQRTGFENENFQFGGRKKSKGDGGNTGGLTNESNTEILIPNILISCPDNPEEDNMSKKNKTKPGSEVKSCLTDVMNEITKDLSEMEIVREERKNESESREQVEVHAENLNLKRLERSQFVSENERSKAETDKGQCGSSSRRGSQISEGRGTSYKKDSISFSQGDSGGSESSALTEITKYGETANAPPSKTKGRKKSKSLSWKKKNEDDDEAEEDESATQEFLPQENAADVSLRSVLNHIAYINRGQQAAANAEDDLEKVGKSKVEWVLNITYITAMWGLMLCLSNMGRIYSPFGVPETRKILSSPPSSSLSSNSTYWTDHVPTEPTTSEILFSPWPWLWFQTFCRALELAMGCAMANITRQPTANSRYPRALSLRHRDNFYNI